jgi:metallophosphoesterase (TIGR03767 family)
MGRLLTGSGRKPANVLGLVRATVHAAVSTDTQRWDAGGLDWGLQRVTPDPEARRPVPLSEWLDRLLGGPEVPGPVGHGFGPHNREAVTSWWSRPHGDHVQLVGLDTCNHTTGSEGALCDAQFRWLEAELERLSTRWRDRTGRWVTGPGPDRLVVLFSHHSSWTLTNPADDAEFPGPRHLGDDVLALLHRFPNVVLWVNGHTHEHRIEPHRGVEGHGFWEVNTASCIDFGQQARTVEVVDNGDGTLSVLATVLDHAAPPSVAIRRDGDYSPAELASLSRELSANDARWVDPFDLLGRAEDRNVELVVRAPFPLR